MRVLVARAGALGDLLLLRPVLAALRRAGRECVLWAPAQGDLLVDPQAPGAPAQACDPCGARFRIAWDDPSGAALHVGATPAPGRLAEMLEHCQAALLYSRQAPLAAALARSVPLVWLHDPAPAPGAGHAAAWFLRAWHMLELADGLRGVQPVPARPPQGEWPPEPAASAEPPLLRAPAHAGRRAARRLEALPPGFLALHPGSSAVRKNWPAACWAGLAERLSPTARWLLLIGPAELEHGTLEELRRADPRAMQRAVIAEQPEPAECVALLAAAGLYVGNDSGVSHLAAASGAPTLALFGPTDPRTWAPRGPHVHTLRAPGAQLEALALDAVCAAAEKLRATART